MDPISLGMSVGLSLITPTATRMMKAAADPEVVAKSVNWVFAAVDNFLKIRRREAPDDSPIPSPPQVSTAVTTNASASEIESKTANAEEIIKSARHTVHDPPESRIRPLALDEFAAQELAAEVESLINQLETYARTLRFEEEKAAQFGGIQFSPPIVMHTIRIQQEEIAKRLVRLNRCMQRAYGVAAPSIDSLVQAIRST